MIKGAAAVITLLALALAAAGCGPDAIPDDEASQPFEGTAVTTGAGGAVLVVGVRGPDSDRGCQQSLAVARLDAEGRTAGRAGVAAGSIDDSCLPKVERVVNDRQGRLVVYGSSFDVGFLGDSEPGPSVLLGFEPSGRLDPGLGDGGVIVDPELQTPFAALPDGRLVDFSGTIVDGSETERTRSTRRRSAAIPSPTRWRDSRTVWPSRGAASRSLVSTSAASSSRATAWME